MSAEGENKDPEQKPEDKPAVPDLDALIKAAVDKELADIKSKLDNAYKKRDEVQKELDAYRDKERQAEIESLKEQGKLKEAHEKELEALKARNAELEQQNVSLTRDSVIKAALAGLELRNARASEMAHKEISKELIRDDAGNWVHRSGKSITEFVAEFAADQENAFLFKAKVNNGGGQQGGPAVDPKTGKSLFALSQAEVLELARQGKLKKR